MNKFICQFCNSQFDNYKDVAKFCSHKCLCDSMRLKTKKCPQCDVEFQPQEGKRQKFCSQTCFFLNVNPDYPLPDKPPPDNAGYIKLSSGKWAIVDFNMFEYLSQWVWYAYTDKHGHWYTRRNISDNGKSKPIRMHRVVMEYKLNKPIPDNLFVDHWNHDGLDNRFENLSVVTTSQNMKNRFVLPGRKFKGVTKYGNKFKAIVDRRPLNPTFKTEEEAAKYYDKIMRDLYGSTVRFNFPNPGESSVHWEHEVKELFDL